MPAVAAASFLPTWLRSPKKKGQGAGHAAATNSKVMTAADDPAANTTNHAEQQQQQQHQEQRPSAGVAAYNVAQLSALRAHVASRALGLLPATSAACASFRSSNEVLLAHLDREIERQGSLVLAAQSDAFGSDDEQRQGGGSSSPTVTSCRAPPTTTAPAVPSTEEEEKPHKEEEEASSVTGHVFFLAQQARLAAQLEVRNAEAAAYVEHRAKVKVRQIQALARRLACYIAALVLLVAGFSTFLALPAAHGVLLFVVLTMGLAVLFLVMGYIMGEGWRLRVASERELRQRIETRAGELLAEFEETYRVQQQEERRREAEAEERRKEAERLADEELLRSIEAGGQTSRRNRFGKGSMSSTDIKLPDATSSCCEETTLHAGVVSSNDTDKPAASDAVVKNSEEEEEEEGAGGRGGCLIHASAVVGGSSSATQASSVRAVRRWVFGGNEEGHGQEGAGRGAWV